jgi:RHS repeat-associated protein
VKSVVKIFLAGASAALREKKFPQGEQIGTTNYYFVKDHLGSVREVYGAGGALQVKYAYDPYGVRTRIVGAIEVDSGFTGHYIHPSGLLITLHRAYDPETAHWLSRDPIGEDGGVNLYGYVKNNPVNYWDPLGLDVFFKSYVFGSGPHSWTSIGGKNPDVNQSTYGFGPAKVGVRAGNYGVVYHPDPWTDIKGLKVDYKQYKTTPQQEEEIENWIKKNYGINTTQGNKRCIPSWYDCRHTKQEIEDKLREILTRDAQGTIPTLTEGVYKIE